MTITDTELPQIVVFSGQHVIAPNLIKLGSVLVDSGATFEAPILTLAGHVGVFGSFIAPRLIEAGDMLIGAKSLYETPLLERAEKISLEMGRKLKAPHLNQIGILSLQYGSELDAPSLIHVGNLDLDEGANLIAPLIRIYSPHQ